MQVSRAITNGRVQTSPHSDLHNVLELKMNALGNHLEGVYALDLPVTLIRFASACRKCHHVALTSTFEPTDSMNALHAGDSEVRAYEIVSKVAQCLSWYFITYRPREHRDRTA